MCFPFFPPGRLRNEGKKDPTYPLLLLLKSQKWSRNWFSEFNEESSKFGPTIDENGVPEGAWTSLFASVGPVCPHCAPQIGF